MSEQGPYGPPGGQRPQQGPPPQWHPAQGQPGPGHPGQGRPGPAPYGQQPHPAQQTPPPYGQQPPYGGPPQHWGPPGQPPKRRRTGLVIGLAAVGLLLVAGLAIALVWLLGGDDDDEPGEELVRPEEIARQYLDAVAAGDAERALSLIEVPADVDDVLLTGEVLAHSNEIAPLTGIEVDPLTAEDPALSADVTARFRLGDEPAEVTLSLREEEDGWRIVSRIPQLLVSDYGELGTTVNGQEVEPGQYPVLPGAYELGTPAEYFTFTGQTVTTILDETSLNELSAGPELELTAEGLSAFRQAVISSVEDCMAATGLEARCGLDLPSRLSDGTEVSSPVSRTLPSETRSRLESLEPTVTGGGTEVSATLHQARVEVEADCSVNGQSGRCPIGSQSMDDGVPLGGPLGMVTVDMGADPPTVDWLHDTLTDTLPDDE